MLHHGNPVHLDFAPLAVTQPSVKNLIYSDHYFALQTLQKDLKKLIKNVKISFN